MGAFDTLRVKLASLPVIGVIDPVVRDVLNGVVTVVAARTGSGKSMLLPSALAGRHRPQITVLAPRRFLVIDAAFNVAELSGIKSATRSATPSAISTAKARNVRPLRACFTAPTAMRSVPASSTKRARWYSTKSTKPTNKSPSPARSCTGAKRQTQP